MANPRRRSRCPVCQELIEPGAPVKPGPTFQKGHAACADRAWERILKADREKEAAKGIVDAEAAGECSYCRVAYDAGDKIVKVLDSDGVETIFGYDCYLDAAIKGPVESGGLFASQRRSDWKR